MQKPSILLINDASQLFHMMNCVFQSKGYESLVVDEFGDAFKKLSTQYFDLVIIKLNINRIAYLPVFQIIKEVSRSTKIAIISDNSEMIDDFCPVEIDDIIVLPCKISKICDQILNILNKSISDKISSVNPHLTIPINNYYSKLSLLLNKERESLLSIATCFNILTGTVTGKKCDILRTMAKDTNNKITELVSTTEEVINGLLVLEELSEELIPENYQSGPMKTSSGGGLKTEGGRAWHHLSPILPANLRT